jgi:hypothetical protein
LKVRKLVGVFWLRGLNPHIAEELQANRFRRAVDAMRKPFFADEEGAQT